MFPSGRQPYVCSEQPPIRLTAAGEPGRQARTNAVRRGGHFGPASSCRSHPMPTYQSLPAFIRTPRLVLRRQQPGDAPLIKDAVDTSLPHLQSSVAWALEAPTPLPVLTARLAASAAAFDAGEAWAFSLFDLTQTRVLGGAGLEPAEAELTALLGSRTVETGYWLRADCTGQGYATEATAHLIELAFTRLGAHRVAVCHDPSNTPSQGVPRRLGFQCFGTVPDAILPGRQAADGSVRPATRVWVLEARAHTTDLLTPAAAES